MYPPHYFKLTIACLGLVIMALFSSANLYAAGYLKLSASEAASIQVDKLAVIDQDGNRFINSLQIKATDKLDLHVGQKYALVNLAQTSAGIEDGAFGIVDKKLVIPKLIQDQLPSYNVTLSLTNIEPVELTVIGLGVVGPQGLKGDTGAQGPKGETGAQGAIGLAGAADGLTTSVNGVTQVGGAIILTKAHIGLANADNTSDLNKPVSTATQTALALKADLASPAFTGLPSAPTANAGENTDQIATTAFVTQALTGTPHTIGEAFGGGIVFYVTPNGLHGLVAATQNQATGVSWFDATYYASNPFSHNAAGKNFTDWRLPTIGELTLLYLRKAVVGGFEPSSGAPCYWSSTEIDAAAAWCRTFDIGISASGIKVGGPAIRVRAVRAF